MFDILSSERWTRYNSSAEIEELRNWQNYTGDSGSWTKIIEQTTKNCYKFSILRPISHKHITHLHRFAPTPLFHIICTKAHGTSQNVDHQFTSSSSSSENTKNKIHIFIIDIQLKTSAKNIEKKQTVCECRNKQREKKIIYHNYQQ